MPVLAGLLVLMAALALGGCAMPDFDSFRNPDAATLFRPMSVTNTRERALPPVGPGDMVDAEGRCANAAGSPASDAASEAAHAAVMSAGIAIDMTECEVIRRAGAPDQVALGTNERSERTATLTFLQGTRPGIYHFTAGRLTLMERAPEPPARPDRRAPGSRSPRTAGR